MLLLAFFFAIVLIVNSAKRISSLNSTSKKVDAAQQQLVDLKKENETLKQELEYKKSDQFAEKEIRNKLGLAKPGEAVVILPNNDSSKSEVKSEKLDETPNYKKWWDLFFGG